MARLLRVVGDLMTGRCVIPIIGRMFAVPATAQNYAQEIAANSALLDVCQADRGRLWGAELCGPLIIVDPKTRAAWANQADCEGVLQRQGIRWTGLAFAGSWS